MSKTKSKGIGLPAKEKLSSEELIELDNMVTNYMDYLDKGVTPQSCVNETINAVNGSKLNFLRYAEGMAKGSHDGIYLTNEDHTSIGVIRFGEKPIEDGLTILGAHVDSPCLHAKVHPLKNGKLGMKIDTQYYGGFYAHHWFDTDVKVIGHVVRNGQRQYFELEGIIMDPTIHIVKKSSQSVSNAFSYEDLDVLTGFSSKEKLLSHVAIDEKDFARADVYIVPAAKTKKYGDLDLIVGYGHDDRICVYTQAMAMLRSKKPKYTTMLLDINREEIGSSGLDGAAGVFFEQVLDAAVYAEKKSFLVEGRIRSLLRKSLMLSADVDIMLNDRNIGKSDPQNAAKMGHGLVLCRYNGSGGQYSGNRAGPVLMDKLISTFDDANIVYQVSAIPSKVGEGGGGTIAKYFSQRGVPTVDAGVPVAGMHCKRSIVNSADLYMAYKGFKAFIDRS